ncbi:hypothetical protein SeLEV6574_g06598 [Synchytrium endobioticum]|uniref:Uncharacterized protein n=1 Tax=Synchytrium endobioticum TaxID=286115 RepID=A0A507CL39_9FUNG|nr:hypothetical protein SeLEV6574_g06598 [Synchytrium endobioticum]
MVKTVNVVIFLAAIITSIETAPVWDDHARTGKMLERARCAANHRKRDLRTSSLARILEDHNEALLQSQAQIAGVVSKSSPSFFPFSKEQLFQEPHESTPVTQILFTRAYHTLVFEKLKTLFLKIEPHSVTLQYSKILKNGIESVAAHLLWSFELEEKCRKVFPILARNCFMNSRVFTKFRKLEFPVYDWDYVRINLLPALKQPAQGLIQTRNDVTTGEMLESLWKRVENVIVGRNEEVLRGLPFNLHAVLDLTPYVATLIAWIRSDARPFTFTEAQLLKVPKATIPVDQLYLTHAYHHLVVETLENLGLTITDHSVKLQNREKLGTALAEVARAKTMHQNLRNKCEIIIQRIQDEDVNWQENVNLPAYELAPVNSMQFPTDSQYSAYNYESIFDYGLGYGLEASTSQPGPQPGFSDFLDVVDMPWEATPELAPRFGYSHDDRYPLSDDCFSNELHRPPSEHGGFVWGSSMHPGPSTDNINAVNRHFI